MNVMYHHLKKPLNVDSEDDHEVGELLENDDRVGLLLRGLYETTDNNSTSGPPLKHLRSLTIVDDPEGSGGLRFLTYCDLLNLFGYAFAR